MARIKIENIIDYLDSDFRRALDAAIQDVSPDSSIDSHELFRAFKRSVSRKFSTWTRIPDQYIERE